MCFLFSTDDKNDPPYAPPGGSEVASKRPRRSSDFTSSHVATTPATNAELLKGVVLHAVQSSQHPSVKLRSPNGK